MIIMLMKRLTVSMYSDDMDLFERGRAETGMSRSAYVRLLVAEHEKQVPVFWKYRELIQAMSEFNTSVNKLVLSGQITDLEKLKLSEQMDVVNQLLEKLAGA